MKTFKTIHYKDMITTKDVIDILKDVGFKKLISIHEKEMIGYILEPGPNLTQQLRVYLNDEYLWLNSTLSQLEVEIYKREGTFLSHGKIRPTDWFKVSKMVYTKINEFKNFLLLSICRDSFLDPEDDAYKFKGMASAGFSEDWHDWYI